MINLKDIRRTPLLQVEWTDATSTSGWGDASVTGEDCIRVVSVGWKLRRTKRELTIVQSVSTNGRVAERLSIPAGMIRRVRRLRP